MPKADVENTTTNGFPSTTRRGLLAGAAALSATGAAAAVPALAAASEADAELIRICHRFAEEDLANWYQYVVAPVEMADEEYDFEPDWATLRWITATPATTAEGWRAKALAYSAWDRAAYGPDHDGDRDSGAPLLAALLRDMVAPVRNAIIAQLAAKHGPLPATYSPEGVWLGSDASVVGLALPTAPVSTDAELLSACADFRRAQARLDDLQAHHCRAPFGDPRTIEYEAEIERVDDLMQGAIKALTALPARTPEGWRAKASVARAALEEGAGLSFELHEELALSVLADLVGEA